jgi:hypothetical protein
LAPSSVGSTAWIRAIPSHRCGQISFISGTFTPDPPGPVPALPGTPNVPSDASDTERVISRARPRVTPAPSALSN